MLAVMTMNVDSPTLLSVDAGSRVGRSVPLLESLRSSPASRFRVSRAEARDRGEDIARLANGQSALDPRAQLIEPR